MSAANSPAPPWSHGSPEQPEPGLPTLSLPKGGGAIRGIGEKFETNPVTGTGSLTVPVAVSPGRSGFGPQLTLAYDSGAGNGPFGFGWRLAIPSITRKTDKGLPRYRDAEESDVFLLSGAEDLVPVLVERDGKPGPHAEHRTIDGVDHEVRRYRPRIEGPHALIERWTVTTTGISFWRSISRENVMTIYGGREDARVADPGDPRRVFSWLLCESWDDRGNAFVYEYKPEDAAGVDPGAPHELNRLAAGQFAERHLKRIRYGNRTPRQPGEVLSQRSDWMFEVVFDYGEGHYEALPLDSRRRRLVRASPEAANAWPVRLDPFSDCRAGFERRTYRLCRRVLMFHHFPEELGPDPCLVRTTSLDFEEDPIASYLVRITMSGYRRENGGRYLEKSLPALELEYSRPEVDDTVRTLDSASCENLPAGIAGARDHWVDLEHAGLPGVLSETAGGWHYKRNLGGGRLAPIEQVAARPALAPLASGRTRFMDLAGDGRTDLVQLAAAAQGFSERTDDGDWTGFTPLGSQPGLDWRDPRLRLIDLTGDGSPDILVTGDEAFTWYPSLGEEGFGEAVPARLPLDEERGPRLAFSDAAECVHFADMTGDGLADIVRIRNGEVCYWPNLGYGRFGAKVTMTGSPRFDTPDHFDPKRIRLADIDGTGVADIVYLGRDCIDLYFNRSGNAWSGATSLRQLPPPNRLGTVEVLDLLGAGTACLVWSSRLPSGGRASVRYVDLMAGGKPHLLRAVTNNLGAGVRLQYAPSTRFFAADRDAGRPWITRLPFPVHVVERVETFDRVRKNRFVTRYAYHHGHFDGVEREFRGFGMVEQWDTEEYAAFAAGGELPEAANLGEASHLPPVLTRTWFHTGADLRGRRVARRYEQEYYREPGSSDEDFLAALLPDTTLPAGLSAEEERQAARALKGTILRREVYGLDGTERAAHPYTVSERAHAVRMLQPMARNRAAVFLVHPTETLELHYERRPGDPRAGHQLTAEVDGFGNVLKALAIGYGRRPEKITLVDPRDREVQSATRITYTENDYTNPIDLRGPDAARDAFRTPLPAGSRTWELTGYTPSGAAGRFRREDFLVPADGGWALRVDEDIPYETPPGSGRQRRLIEALASRYRRDDFTGALPHGQIEPLALADRSYRLAFTPGLLAQLYGGRVTPAMLAQDGGYVDLHGDGSYWVPTDRRFYSPGLEDTPAAERARAEQHFFVPCRLQNPLGAVNRFDYDSFDLLLRRTTDPAGNVVTAENDYRVLQPRRITDPNGNRTEAAFDAMGRVAGTAVTGKQGEALGDSLQGFEADPDPPAVEAFFADPAARAPSLLGSATTRIVYDLGRFARSGNEPEPAFAATVARETHGSEPAPSAGLRIRVDFGYSDGFGREVQRKTGAAPGPLDPGLPGSPAADPRWVGSGWALLDNKGNQVRLYEPFFSSTHRFEPRLQGLSSIQLRDPLGRVVATVHPNGTYEKVVFDAWRREDWDANDTIHPVHRFNPQQGTLPDSRFRPSEDPDAGALIARLPEREYWPTWYRRRIDPAERLSAWPDAGADGNPLPHNQQVRAAELRAAETAARHAATPATVHFDGMGRAFLTVSDNGRLDSGADRLLHRRVAMDIEGNELAVTDALDRTVQTAGYDMLSNRRMWRNMDTGQRRTLADVFGHTIYSWDDRDHRLRIAYDGLRRMTHVFVSAAGAPELLARRTVYGETQPDPESRNLRRRVYRLYDAAGVVSYGAYDFKGNLLSSRRELRAEYAAAADWSAEPQLEPGAFESATVYDALNRATVIIAPHAAGPGAAFDVIQPGYDEAGRLARVDVWLGRPEAPAAPLDPATADLRAVTRIDYDAKGQRSRIEYGNGIVADYAYDPATFRLVHLRTGRPSFPAAGRQVQDLRYTYDPVGNVASIRDGAQQAVFFDNAVVEASADYQYDALYRLIRATGREHQGEPGGSPATWDDAVRTKLAHPHDGSRLRRYAEEYRYDDAGNILSLIHQANGGGWTQAFSYTEPSLLEPERTSNRLSSTAVGGVPPETFEHDAHGNMTRMAHLPAMAWDFEDRLVRTGRQVANGAAPERTFYVYDAAGARIRKVTERPNGTRRTEVIQLGGFEITREYESGAPSLERRSLHVMDDGRRIALVETRTLGEDGTPQRLIRFQLDNHLESASVELDERGEVISYEEYYPYGSTSYQAMDAAVRAAAKRYRFSGKERDGETGLYHFGARYYASWLGRWTAPDPAGLGDGLNPFAYARANPVMLRDPTGSTNVPATATDRRIMLMTDAQLHQHLKSLSPEARANFARGATGMFATRAWATLNRAGMAIGYELPADRITATPPKPKPKPAPQPQKSGSPASLPNVVHPEPWTPPAVVRKGWERLIDEAADSSNPWYARAGAGVGAIVGILPTGGEVIVHGIIAAPQLAVTETIAAGEHIARGTLLSEQGSDEAALDEYLAAAQAGFEGTSNAATTVAVVGGGVQAVRGRAGKPGTVNPTAAGERPSTVDPLASTEPPPRPSQTTTDPYVPSEPAPPSQPPPSGPPEPPPVEPLGPTQTPGPWAPDIPPGRYTPGFDPRNPRIPRPPRPPNIPKIDYD